MPEYEGKFQPSASKFQSCIEVTERKAKIQPRIGISECDAETQPHVGISECEAKTQPHIKCKSKHCIGDLKRHTKSQST